MERGTVTAAPGASSVIFRSSLTGNCLLSLLAAVTALACGSSRQVDVPGGERADPPARIEETVTSEPKLEVHRGTLAQTVEEGGWLLKTTGKEYLLLSISSYRNEPWLREGAGVEVKGREMTDVMTIYMQGTPFRVSAMKPSSPAGERHR